MKLALLFPGQGSQAVGMGKDAFAASPAAQAVYFAADGALGETLSNLCFEGPEDALRLTANTQPALVATSIALLELLRERLPSLLDRVVFAAGHSLGEYSALVAAGALALPDAIRLVRIRGRAMQEAVPPGMGAMAAVMGLPAETVAGFCTDEAKDEVVSPANFNGGQIVIAGHKAAVERVMARASAEKGKAIALPVSAPFHCALMAPAARTMETHLEKVAIGAFRFPVVANVDAAPNQDTGRVKDLLVRQIDGVVRWEETVRFLAKEGVTHALEVGPGKVLAGLVKRIDKSIEVLPASDVASVDAAAKALGG